MTDTIQIGELSIQVTKKAVKNVHLSVHPPDGRVTLVAPSATRLEVARAYAISKLGWIRRQQQTLADQARETPRQFIGRESHYVWGRRYLLIVVERETKPFVALDHRKITLTVRPGSDQAIRRKVMHAWHKTLLHKTIPPLLEEWSAKLGVRVAGYYLQRMKTRWGSCNHGARHVRFNTELVKKPKDLLVYVVIHELAHLIEPTHSERFVAILQANCPHWREARKELNELPLGAAFWEE
jgi:predicted metal-dependent hydrolase